MRHFATLGAVCAVGLSALAGQAQADIYHFTVTGTVATGLDTRGLFGSDGADLSGRRYSATYTFDPDLLESIHNSGGAFEDLTYVGEVGIFQIEIDGVEHAFTAGGPYQFSFARVKADPAATGGWTDGVNASLNGSSGSVNMGIVSTASFFGPLGLTAPQSYTLTEQDYVLPLEEANVWDGGDFKFVFRPGTISLTSEPGTLAPGVPEPASWALMIGGFGGAGAMLRRRRVAFAA